MLRRGRSSRQTRRQFIGSAAKAVAGASLFSIVPAHVVAALRRGTPLPSNTVTRAVIGTGGMGLNHVIANKEGEAIRTVAVCDVDADHLADGLKKAGRGCTGYADFRRVLERKDIDAVHVPTPPHWHSLISIAAMQAGFDVYCEKPLTRFVREGRVMCDTVARTGRMLQVNTYGRGGFVKLRRLVASGLLGSPLTVRLNPKTGCNWKVAEWSGRTDLKPESVPARLDYDLWQGPAPVKPYHPHRVHQSFRGYWDYDGGGLGDMGMHWLDPVMYALGHDASGPHLVEAEAPWPPHPDATGMWGKVTFGFANGDRIIIESDEWGPKVDGTLPFLEGPKGKVLEREGVLTDPPGLFDQSAKFPIPDRWHDFERAVRTRDGSGSSHPTCEEAHRTVTIIHLANIAIRTGRPVRWDPVKEEILGDPGQAAFLNIPMRKPWHL